jgi:hypothetical protein
LITSSTTPASSADDRRIPVVQRPHPVEGMGDNVGPGPKSLPGHLVARVGMTDGGVHTGSDETVHQIKPARQLGCHCHHCDLPGSGGEEPFQHNRIRHQQCGWVVHTAPVDGEERSLQM